MGPKFKHDCSYCNFIKTIDIPEDEQYIFNGGSIDVYIHDTKTRYKSLYLKHGDDEQDYTSYPILDNILDQVSKKSKTLKTIVEFINNNNFI